MNKIRLSELSPVAQTLALPLVLRAREAQRDDPLLVDHAARALLDCFGDPLDAQVHYRDLEQACVMMRARYFDRRARRFLSEYPGGAVIDIGCGLDTRFERLDNGQMTWFGIDLPEVIEVRRQVLPETPRSRLIARSALDFTWMDEVAAAQLPVIVLAEGLLPYFTEDEVRRLVLALAERFPGAEMVLDGVSTLAVRFHNAADSSLKETGAQALWTLDDSRALEQWSPELHLTEEWFYTQERERRLGWFNLTRFIPAFGKAHRVVCYRLGGDASA